MRASVFLYPWDVVGDPEAPERLASLGIRHVTLASAYHSTRAVTPRHPRHRVVTARHSAVLYEPDEQRWDGARLRPREQRWIEAEGPDGAFGAAARALTRAGIEVRSWVVLAHNSLLGSEHPEVCVRNAYGDRYPWALCLAQPEVRDYLAALAGEAAVRPGAAGTELESCGWYGLAHLHAHDKIAGVPLDGAADYLMSLCFCSACRTGYAGQGADPERVRIAVMDALEPRWRGTRSCALSDPAEQRAAEWREVERLLGTETAGLLSEWRRRTAATLRHAVTEAVRDEAADGFEVLLHADPAPHRTGANPGVAPADAFAAADGVVVPCTGSDAGRDAALTPFVRAARAARAEGLGGTGAREAPADGPRRAAPVIAANLTFVAGLGGSPERLDADVRHARTLGATELRFYHAGLASDAELRQLARTLG
ncbi:hypothetical protein [Streptomyces xiaopingdaonensis]|uniref:hypothetical protein n=1 Tax=Streptomyces xiaopingdaonensis TaxID=1565415 RepID=UPI00036DD2C2|nr:hypothetical protein [Streptomyces xiaopingdaonensis]